MPMSNRLEYDLLELILQNEIDAVNSSLDDIGTGTGLGVSATDGNLYLSLHTAAPGDTGDQTSSEVDGTGTGFLGYAREPISRTLGGWNSSGTPANPDAGTVFSNAAVIGFGPSTGVTVTITHFGIGTEVSGTGNLLFWGPLGIANSRAFTFDNATNAMDLPAHGFNADDQVVFITTIGATLPTGLTEGTVYYVHSNTTTDQFVVATGPADAGGEVVLSAAGGGRVQQIVQKQIDNGDSLEFGVAALSIELD